MKDETKAGIVAGVWLGFLAVLCARPGVVSAVLFVCVTVVLAMYIKHDWQDEQRRKRIKRLVDDDRRRLREAEK
ncbi:MAG: hypothetical protein IKO27_08155 [Ruminococcus sp.]|nr:hypothetical protein [Ruminococcus sp.]